MPKNHFDSAGKKGKLLGFPRVQRQYTNRPEMEDQSQSNNDDTDSINVALLATTSTENQPRARSSHKACLASDDSLYIIGGYSGSTALHDVHRLDLMALSWHRVPTSGDVPKGRYACAGAFVRERGCLYLHGGMDVRKECQPDTLQLDFSTGRWTCLHNSNHRLSEEGQQPEARAGHDMAPIDAHSLLMFGGCSPGGMDCQTWKFDIDKQTWERVAVNNSCSPAARSGHSMHAMRDSIILLGGLYQGAKECDVFVIDKKLSGWRQVAQCGGTKPTARAGAATCVVRSKFVIVHSGGGPDGCAAHDTWLLDAQNDPDEWHWAQLTSSVLSPRPCVGATFTSIDAFGSLICFGGGDAHGVHADPALINASGIVSVLQSSNGNETSTSSGTDVPTMALSPGLSSSALSSHPFLRRGAVTQKLNHFLLDRPSASDLANRNILPNDHGKIDPSLAATRKQLHRSVVEQRLNKHLQHRPARNNLVDQNILPDAAMQPMVHAATRRLRLLTLSSILRGKLLKRPSPEEMAKQFSTGNDGGNQSLASQSIQQQNLWLKFVIGQLRIQSKELVANKTRKRFNTQTEQSRQKAHGNIKPPAPILVEISSSSDGDTQDEEQKTDLRSGRINSTISQNNSDGTLLEDIMHSFNDVQQLMMYNILDCRLQYEKMIGTLRKQRAENIPGDDALMNQSLETSESVNWEQKALEIQEDSIRSLLIQAESCVAESMSALKLRFNEALRLHQLKSKSRQPEIKTHNNVIAKSPPIHSNRKNKKLAMSPVLSSAAMVLGDFTTMGTSAQISNSLFSSPKRRIAGNEHRHDPRYIQGASGLSWKSPPNKRGGDLKAHAAEFVPSAGLWPLPAQSSDALSDMANKPSNNGEVEDGNQPRGNARSQSRTSFETFEGFSLLNSIDKMTLTSGLTEEQRYNVEALFNLIADPKQLARSGHARKQRRRKIQRLMEAVGEAHASLTAKMACETKNMARHTAQDTKIE